MGLQRLQVLLQCCGLRPAPGGEVGVQVVVVADVVESKAVPDQEDGLPSAQQECKRSKVYNCAEGGGVTTMPAVVCCWADAGRHPGSRCQPGTVCVAWQGWVDVLVNLTLAKTLFSCTSYLTVQPKQVRRLLLLLGCS